MIEDWLLVIIPSLVAAVLSSVLGFIVWRDHSRPYQRDFSIMAWCVTMVSLVMLGENLVWTETEEMALFAMETALDIAILIHLYLFVMDYTGMTKYASKRIISMWTGFGLIALSLVFSNPWLHLFVRSMSISNVGGIAVLDVVFGPGIYIWISFCLSIVVFCAVILMASFLNTPHGERKKFAYIGGAFLCAIITALVFWASADDNNLVNYFAIGLAISVVLLFLGTVRSELMQAPPITVLELLENAIDGTVLVDDNGKITYWNKAAREALKDENGADLPSERWFKNEPEYDLRLDRNGKTAIWNVRTTRLSGRGREAGTVLLFRDVTEKREMESSLAKANGLLSIMQSVNRHDLRNDAVALAGYLELMAMEGTDDDYRIEKAIKVLRRMTQRIDQLKDLAGSEGNEDRWQVAEQSFNAALRSLDVGRIRILVELGGLEISTAQMMERIFYTLVDNTLRHGEGVRNIKVTCKQVGSTCVISYEDDGKGIPLDSKERIFERGYGQNTGMGLYLSREIARMTGMTMVENGSNGARFELTVPSGRWRWGRVVTGEFTPEKAKG